MLPLSKEQRNSILTSALQQDLMLQFWLQSLLYATRYPSVIPTKLQAVCIQLKIHQSLSNLIKIQVGILDKNEMFQFFFGLLLNNVSISAALSQDGSWTAEAETVETAVIDFPHESSFVDIWTRVCVYCVCACALVQTI